MRESLKEAKRRREEAEKQDSLSASYREKDDDFEEVDEEYEEGPPREGTVVLRERSRGRQQHNEGREDDEGYGQRWSDWNEDEYESRGHDRERSQRRSKGYEKGYEKGKGKGLKASPKHTKENWQRRKERIRGGISHRKSPRIF